jgi:hypothetical protein
MNQFRRHYSMKAHEKNQLNKDGTLLEIALNEMLGKYVMKLVAESKKKDECDDCTVPGYDYDRWVLEEWREQV